MSDTTLLVSLVGAALAGGVLAWLILRGNGAALRSQLADRTREAAELRQAATTAQAAASHAAQERDHLSGQLDAERRMMAEKLALIEDAQAKLQAAFALASQEALAKNNEAFLALAETRLGEFQRTAQGDLEARQKSIDALVKPVQEGIEKLDTNLQAFNLARTASQAALEEQLKSMATTQLQLTGETQSLVKALRAPQTRGQWGEMQLRRTVELAGMLEHCDFFEQQTVQSEGGALRPDMIVRLPGQKAVIVDSKAPLAAFLDAMETNDPVERDGHLDRHARQVRDHIVALSDKNYAKEFSEAPDFVVLFLPGEAFFSAACSRDPGLVDFAVGRRVIPASPTTLITLLKTVAYGWQQERIAANAESIRKLGQDLHDRIATVAKHLVSLRNSLEKTVESYNKTVGSLEGRVLPAARRLKELGVGEAEAIELLSGVESQPRALVAPELIVPLLPTDEMELGAAAD